MIRRRRPRMTESERQRLREVREAYKFFGVAPASSHPDSVFFSPDGEPLFNPDEDDEDDPGAGRQED